MKTETYHFCVYLHSFVEKKKRKRGEIINLLEEIHIYFIDDKKKKKVS